MKLLSSYVRQYPWVVFVLIAFASMLFMMNASQRDSLIMDELAHIPAGYGYVKYLDFRLNPEHPPLLKAIAAFPLSFMGLNFPTDKPAWTSDLNGQWVAGTQFIFESGNDADQLIRVSRIGPMILTLIVALLIFLWASSLFGKLWALVPTLLFAFSPHILGHGHYVTTDIAAMFGVVIATFTFLRFVKNPSRSNLFWAGIAFGLAQASKFSAVLLIPYFLMLFFAYYVMTVRRDWLATLPKLRLRRFGLRALRYVEATAIIFVIGYALVIYPMYFAFTRNYPVEKQIADTTEILSTFGNGPTPVGQTCQPARCLAELNIYLAGQEWSRPMAHYMLGVLMVMQRAAGGNTAYFLGDVTNVGSRLYFPIAYLLKEPLPAILFALAALIFAIWRISRAFRHGIRNAWEAFFSYIERHFDQFALIVWILFYLAYSMKSPLNIGFRHLFPILPFVYILATSAWRNWITRTTVQHDDDIWAAAWFWMKERLGAFAKYSLMIVLLFWFVLETVIAAPHFLSYYNEIGGGVQGGYRYITDSNYDWGQDMYELKKFMDANPGIDWIAVDHFGGSNVNYYLGDRAVPWWSAKGNPAEQGIEWFAVSVNSIQGAIHPTTHNFSRPERDEYRWLTALRPVTERGEIPTPDLRLGTTILVYHLK